LEAICDEVVRTEPFSHSRTADSSVKQRKVDNIALVVTDIRRTTLLVSLLEKWQLDKERIAIEPTVVPSNEYYSRIYFQVRLVDVYGKRTTIAAIGGWYRSASKLKHDKGISL